MNDQEGFLLESFIVESSAIEGLTMDRRPVRTQIQDAWPEGHVGAILALEYLLQSQKVLSEGIIREVQRLIISEQPSLGGKELKGSEIGQYRRINVRVGGERKLAPELIGRRMIDWLIRVHQWQESSSKSYLINVHSVARFHYEFEHIHPFVDGNGRTGRALVWYMLWFCGVEPFVFTSRDRGETYYPAFKEPARMVHYFQSRI